MLCREFDDIAVVGTSGTDDACANECRVFARMLRTGKRHGTYEQLIQPVYCIDALYPLDADVNGSRWSGRS